MQKKHSLARVIGMTFLVGLAVTIVAAFLNAQAIYDWLRLRDYTPPANIAALAENTTMNDEGRKLFYVHHPELNDRDAFNHHCDNGEHSIVLGCYISAQGIYLYDVPDDRLSGVKEVTAAHEMLHAAYDRLSGSERKRVDALTAKAFAELNNERIAQTIDVYRQKDPSIVPNELHSILATEVRDLPEALEVYYRRYFNDRLKVVAYSEKYEAEFISRKKQIETYDQQLETLKQQISATEKTLNSQSAQLESQRQQLDALLAQKDYEAYNSKVEGFNAQVRSYNDLVAVTQADISRYNELVKARNAIALEEQGLFQAIDSRLQTQSAE